MPGQEALARVPVIDEGEAKGKGNAEEKSEYWDNEYDDGYDYVGESDGGDDGDTEGYDPGSVNGYQLTAY